MRRQEDRVKDEERERTADREKETGRDKEKHIEDFTFRILNF